MPEETPSGGKEDLLARNRELEARVQELQETLDAIRSGEVDAIVVAKGGASRIYTLEGPDQPYRALVESISEGALTLSPEGMILYANARFASMVGLPSDRIIGTSFFDHISPEDQPAFQTSYRRLPEGPCRGRVNLRLGPGSLPVSISMSPLSAEPGSRISVVVTDRKEDEEELRTTFQRFYTVLSSAHSAILLANEDGRVEFVNQALCDLYGFGESPADLVGLTSREIIDRVKTGYEHPGEAVAHIKEILGRGEPVHGEEVVIGGKTVLRDFIPLQVGGKPFGCLWHHTDITRLKRAEEALRDSERLLRDVMDGSPLPIFLKDRDGRFLTINATLERMLGVSGEELKDKTDYDIAPKEIADYWRAHDLKVLETGRAIQIEEVADLKDGHHIFLANKFPLINADGKVYGIGAISHDITERKQMEEALREAKDRTATILEGIADTFYALDDQWRFTVVNPAAERAPFGRPASELLGQVIWELYPALVGTPIHRHYLDAAEKLTLEHYEAKSPLDGRWYEVFMQGRSEGVDVYMRDISERRNAEVALRENEERLRLAQEAGRVGVWDLDPATNEVRWTPELEAIYGVVPGSVRTYQDFTTLVHPDDVRTVNAKRDEAVESHRPFEFEFRIKRAGGEIGWVYCRGAAMYDADGRPTRIFGVNIDITGRKQAEEALAASRNQLQGIIDNTPAYVYVLDQEERFLIANRALAGLLNTTPGQMIGKRRHEFMPAETADWHEENDRKVVVAGHSLEFEEYGTFQGKETTLLTTKFPLFDAKNGVYGVAGISVDITGRKQTEDEIRKRSAELRAANEELTRFNRVMVDRELRMIELKEQVNELSRQLGQPPRYSTGSIEEKRP
jgi:PAS domain S-box-containing protein